MKTSYELGFPTLTLPDDMVQAYETDPNAQRVHYSLSTTPLSKVYEIMPTLHRVESGSSGDSMQYAVFGTYNGITPEASFESPPRLAITGGQFAQDYDAGKWIMTEAVRAISTPESPLLYFPTPRLGQSRNMRLTPESLARVSSGDFGPIVDLRMLAIEKWLELSGSPEQVFSFGHSTEASLGTQTAERIAQNIGSVILHSSDDPSLVVGRSPEELKADFFGDKPRQELVKQFDTVRHAGIPALVEAQGITPEIGGGFMSIRRRMLQDIGGLGLSQMMPINRALHRGLAKADNTASIENIKNNGGKVTVTRAEHSRILDEYSFEQITASMGLGKILVTEQGHEYWENVILAGLVNKMGLEQAK